MIDLPIFFQPFKELLDPPRRRSVYVNLISQDAKINIITVQIYLGLQIFPVLSGNQLPPNGVAKLILF